MDLSTAWQVTKTGLAAHAARATAHATNLANVETTRTPEGGPFRPILVALQTKDVPRNGFGVEASESRSDAQPIGRHDPEHPHADADGVVWLPPVDVTREVTSLAQARRAYEANLAAVRAMSSMKRTALRLSE